MRALRIALPLLFLGATAAWAQTGPNPYLSQAKVFYQGLEYEKCLQRLQQAVNWKSSAQELVEIEIYSGLCNYNLGRTKDAEDHFQLALQLNRKAQLPPYTSPKIEALFAKIRDAMPRAPDTATAKKDEGGGKALQVAAASDAPKKAELAPRAKDPSPLDAELRDEGGGRSYAVPIALGGAAAVAAGVGAFMGVQAKTLEQQANAAHFESDAIALGNQARQRALLANVGFGVAGAAATAALVSFLLSGE